MIYLNLNKGIIATFTVDQVHITGTGIPYGAMQDALGNMLNKGFNFKAVRLISEEARNNLKNRGMFSDGETAFIENVN